MTWDELRAKIRTVFKEAQECRAETCPHCARNEEELIDLIGRMLAHDLRTDG